MKTIVQFKWVNYILCEYISVKLLKAKWFSGVNNSPFVLFLHLASKKSLSCSRSTIPFVLIYTILYAKSLQSCLTLCDSMDCSPPGCSVHGILQVGILKWVAMPFSRGSSWPRDRSLLHWQADFLPLAPPWKSLIVGHNWSDLAHPHFVAKYIH